MGAVARDQKALVGDVESPRIERDVERDRIMSAEQAKEYGLVDEIAGPSAGR